MFFVYIQTKSKPINWCRALLIPVSVKYKYTIALGILTTGRSKFMKKVYFQLVDSGGNLISACLSLCPSVCLSVGRD